MAISYSPWCTKRSRNVDKWAKVSTAIGWKHTCASAVPERKLSKFMRSNKWNVPSDYFWSQTITRNTFAININVSGRLFWHMRVVSSKVLGRWSRWVLFDKRDNWQVLTKQIKKVCKSRWKQKKAFMFKMGVWNAQVYACSCQEKILSCSLFRSLSGGG